MNTHLVEQIARAVLYEGYILYPYRPSVKNRQRWTFGGLYPEAFCRVHDSGDASFMQTECLVKASAKTTLKICVRFLHVLSRQVWTASGPCKALVESLDIDGTIWQTWQEATEREVDVGTVALKDIASHPHRTDFAFAAWHQEEPLRDSRKEVRGMLVRQRQPIQGTVDLAAKEIGEGLFKITVGIRNQTPLKGAGQVKREEAVLRALVSTHSILEAADGEFVSLIDPPEPFREAGAGCRNIGTWPVLVGNEDERNMMLSSPIILYDFPEVALESPGDMFDGTEIDEILSLRIMTLTDGEKRAMAGIDERTRALLDRTEALAREQMMKLHGTMKERT